MTKTPDRIGKYEVIRRLGYGGMGTVFLARDPDLDRLLAIKVMRDQMFEEELIQRFLREARAAGNLRHDNIITVYDAGQHEHQPFMAMEYVDGQSLADIIRARQALALAEKLSYLEQICAGLHYAHTKGIVHRDIKPANLMVDKNQTVRILDFGIARVEGSGMTRDGSMIGTLNYMSPEQMLGRPIDHRSDIFAFGAVAYELISYERAFPGSIDDGLLHRVPNEPPRPLAEVCPGLPPDLEPIVMKALAKKPEDRFQDLEEARLALRQIRRQLDPSVELEPIGSRAPGLRGIATPTLGAAATTERQEFLERRARQVAYHRDAARNALKAGDLDAAAAACEDALTLDPDDREALQLRTEIEAAREQRGLLTKEKHERERIVRRHIANADLKLSKGDTAGAAELLRQALALDPNNETARALMARTGEPVPPPVVAATVLVPQKRKAPADGAAHTPTPPEAAASPLSPVPPVGPTPAPYAESEGFAAQATPSTSKRYLAVAAAAAAVIIIGAVVWTQFGGTTGPATETARVDGSVVPPADAGDIAASADPAAATPAAADQDTQPDAASTTSTPEAPALPTPQVTPAAASPQTTPAPPPPTAAAGRADGAAAPAPGPAPASGPATPTTPVRTVPAPIDLTPVDRALTGGDIVGALSALEALPNQTDERVRAAAQRIAVRAMDDMAAAETRASVLDAATLAATPFLSASEAKTRAERAFERQDYSQAVRQALTATSGFRTAAEDARRVADARKKEVEAAAAKAEAAKAAAAKAAATPEFDNAGVWEAMQAFRRAYATRDVNEIRKVATNLSQRAINALKANLDQCRDASVDFASPIVAPVPNDSTAAIVTLRANYVCQPKIRAPAIENTRDEVFGLRKVGNGWLIERMGSWDAAR